jgi:hypothetical protein
LKLIFFTGLIVIFSLPVALFSQTTNPIVFSADDTDSLLEASFQFSPLPEYNQTSTLDIKLKAVNSRLTDHAMRSLAESFYNPRTRDKAVLSPGLKTNKGLELDLVAGPPRYTNFDDTLLIWKPPISAGDSMILSIPIDFNGVGEFNVIISEASRAKDRVFLRIVIAIGEDGKLVYLGKAPVPYNNPLGTHPYVFGNKIEDQLKGLKTTTRRAGTSASEPFDVKLSIDPNLKVGQTSIANLEIEAMSDTVEQLQYEIIAARNLQIDSLSPSPDINPGIGNRFDVSFLITPQKTGRSYLSFEIFGYKPSARHSRIINSRMKYYLIFGADSTLLYMGSVDPFAVGFDKENPAYKPIESIMDFANTGYGEQKYRSEPDFEYDRINNQRVLDSLEASKLIDTLKQEDSIK